MKRLLFCIIGILFLLGLSSCQSKTEKAKSIIEKFCSDFEVEQKAGEIRYYKMGLPAFSSETLNTVMALNKLYGEAKREESRDSSPDDDQYYSIIDIYYKWGGKEVILHEMQYVYKDSSRGGKRNAMFFVKK